MASRTALVSVLLGCIAAFAPLHLSAQTASPSTNALTNRDVADMARAGLSPEVILAKIKGGPCNFDTSPAALKGLKDSGVPDNLIVAMVETASASKTAGSDDTSGLAKDADLASGPAHLRVYRARRVVGAALAPPIVVDGKQIVRVGNGRRCTIKLSPGTHSIGSDDKSSSISLDAKSGQEYFVRVDEEPGMWKGHGKLTLLAAEQGSPEYKLQKPVEEDRKIDKEVIEEESDTTQ